MAKKSENLTSLQRTEAVLAKKKADLEKTQKRYDRLRRAELQKAAKEISRRDQLAGMSLRNKKLALYNELLVDAGEEPEPERVNAESTDQAEPEETNGAGEEPDPVVAKSTAETEPGSSTVDESEARERGAQRAVDRMRENRERSANSG